MKMNVGYAFFLFCHLHYISFMSSSMYSSISSGWQLRTLHISLKVENLMAFALPVFYIDKFAFVMEILLTNKKK